MKRTWLILLSSLTVIIVVLFLGASYFSSMIFGERNKKDCSNKTISTILIEGGGASIAIEDNTCDDGLVVSGAYRVVMKYHEHDRAIEKVLLVQSNMSANSQPPTVKVLAPSVLEISGQKKMVVEKGPTEVGSLQFKYELK